MATEFIVLTLPGYRQIEQLACLEVLAEAQAACGSISIHHVSLSSPGELWRAQSLHALEPGSALVVCSGSPHPLQPFDYSVGAAIKKAWRQDVTLFAVGSASQYLARLGLLNARRVTARPDDIFQLMASCEFVRWDSSTSCAEDRNLVTSVGFLGATEASILTLRALGEGALADLVAGRLDLKLPLTASRRSLGGNGGLAIHPAVQRAVDALHRHPLKAWNIEAVARIACVSERHLQRLFKAEFSCGILEYIQKLRLQRAMNHFKSEPRANLEQIALAAGFSSTQQLRRTWRKQHGHAPSAARKRLVDAVADLELSVNQEVAY